MRKPLTWLGLAISTMALIVVACGSSPTLRSQHPAAAPVPSPSVSPSPTAINAPQVQAADLMAHINAIGYERYFDRDRKKARTYLTQQLEATGWSVSEQPFATGINLFAERPDADPQAGNILVGAHYDTINGSPGADDNASGVAAALEIARLLANQDGQRNLQIALFDQEEAGLVGSYAYAEEASNLENLEGVVNLEMLGYACYTEGCQKKPQGLPVEPPSQVGDFVAVVGDTEHLPLLETFNTPQPSLPTVMTVPIPLKGALTPIALLSDHTPFWYKNIGAVMVTDTAFLRNPHYHRRTDTADSLDPAFFQGATQVALNATMALLNSRESLQTTSSSTPTVETA